MRALRLTPGAPGSLRLDEVPPPPAAAGEVLVETHAVGLCGTDREIVAGEYGRAPPGHERLVLGHESIGHVLEAPAGSGLGMGDWVVGIVRHPDPVPCPSCAVGEWDMCSNGLYTEHGIAGRDGFARERYRSHPSHIVRVPPELGELGVLLEPASVVAKAWQQTERIASRTTWQPKRVLITGAGAIGLLTALFAAERGLEVHVFDRIEAGVKPALVRDLGAAYHSSSLADAGDEWDVVFECTGAPALLFDVIRGAAPNGIVCLLGVSSAGRAIAVDAGALNRELVLDNNVVFGSVNANRRHYEEAARALARADRSWLSRLVTRRLPLERFEEGLTRNAEHVKTILTIGDEA